MRKSRTGKMNTIVSFWKYRPHKGPEPGEEEKTILYKARAEIYDPSMKDMEVLNGIDTKKAVTIVIRDPRRAYIPSNKHYVKIDDYRLLGKWSIIDVRNDITEGRFVTILLGMTNDG